MAAETSLVPALEASLDLQVARKRELDQFMPVMTIDQAIVRYNSVVEFTKRVMEPGTDFGIIPGTGTKPTLLKPGAEKLCTLFGLCPSFVLVKAIEDWTGENHGGEPFFYYHYKAVLSRGGNPVGEGEGSCNSREAKYRWRETKRKCPGCGAEAIIRGKEEYGGGWLCWKKQGGCGTKFQDGDASIEGQQVGRVPNPDISDQVNTMQKMAQKRALIAATLVTTNASAFYTQDIEDMQVIDVTPTEPVQRNNKQQQAALAQERVKQEQVKLDQQVQQKHAPPKDEGNVQEIDPEQAELWRHMTDKGGCINALQALKQRMVDVLGERAGEADYYLILSRHKVQHANEFKSAVAARNCAKELLDYVRKAQAMRSAEQKTFEATDDDLPPVLQGKGGYPD